MWRRSLSVTALAFGLTLPAMGLDDAARSDNAFCFSLLEHQGAAKDNQVFSPFSIWSALAMTSAGAEAETLQQMQKVLSLPAKSANAIVSGWSESLKKVGGVQMKVANRLWGKKGLPFRPGFLSLAEKEYGAGLEPLDFSGNAEGSRKTINQWVAANTENKIKDLLAQGVINADTRLVLTNAIYFNGQWAAPFNARNTSRRAFTLDSGRVVQPETMSDTFSSGWFENDRLQAVRLRYQGGDMAMVLVLPKQKGALTGPAFLQAKGFANVLSGLQEEPRVIVQLPRFEASAKMALSTDLKAMGMPRAFSDEAQFSPLCESPVKIAEVIHQAWIKVAEKGTEAAAATAVVMMRATAMPRKEPPAKTFIADHPFLFFLIDDRNGGIVFAGTVTDPSK